MKKRKMGFFLMILGIVLILGCENDLTGSHISAESDSRAAGSEIEPSATVSKIAEASYQFQMRVLPGDETAIFSEIPNGYYTTDYSDDEGYRGTLKSYSYDSLGAPHWDGDYLIFEIRVYYRGTVYKSVVLYKTVEAMDYQEFRVLPSEANEKLPEISNGYYYYIYSDADGYSGTLRSYDYELYLSPITDPEDSNYMIFRLKVFYKGTVHN